MSNRILEKFLRIAIDRHIENPIILDSKFKFKCNICGDSTKNSLTKRGELFLGRTDNTWGYHCYNGGCPGSGKATNWLQRTDQQLFREYLLEISTGGKYSYKYEYKSTQENLDLLKKKLVVPYHKDFLPILEDPKNELSIKAIEYCKARKVPEEIYSKFFICKIKKFKDRLIIPFYKDSKVYYYQGRSLVGEEPKYLNKIAEKSLCLYNIFNIDASKPVILCEGVFDSIFLENSVAILGVKLNDTSRELIKDFQRYFIFDDDEAGKKTSEEYLKKGEFIFLWRKFKVDLGLPMSNKKLDINETYIYLNRTEKFTFKELQKYFSNNFYDRIYI